MYNGLTESLFKIIEVENNHLIVRIKWYKNDFDPEIVKIGNKQTVAIYLT